MSRHAQIEEVSDSDISDPEEMDPTQFLPTRPKPAPAAQPVSSSSSSAGPAATKAQIKPWACIYPVYFDNTRTRAEGRRVGKELAVENPLAREIVDAVRSFGLNAVLEPGKTHPKDWANPGRVKVRVRGVGGGVNNSEYIQT